MDKKISTHYERGKISMILSQFIQEILDRLALHATYLINCTPSPIINNKTPFELLFHTPLKFQHHDAFGYICYVSTIEPQRSKFAYRATKCLFFGYAYHVKGFRVYDLESQKVFASKDVNFVEYMFHFSSIVTINSNSFIFPHTYDSIIEFNSDLIRSSSCQYNAEYASLSEQINPSNIPLSRSIFSNNHAIEFSNTHSSPHTNTDLINANNHST